MSDTNHYLFTQNTKTMQIPYEEYMELVEKVEEGRRCLAIREQVLAELAAVLGTKPPAPKKNAQPQPSTPAEPVKNEVVAPQVETPVPEPVAKTPVPAPEPEEKKPAPAPVATDRTPSKQVANVPPIKQDIASHFNRVDESGRLFNVFKQYYTCLNDACGGTVRVTLKDGICSIWNYDEWEVFAFVDVFDGRLRIGVNPRYTEQLKALDLCEVPRLLARRHNLICVQVDDLNKTVLGTLVKAFDEAGAAIY